MTTVVRWLETHEVSCFFKSRFGIECPGCGAQRSFIYLLKGNIGESLAAYPPLIFFLGLLLFLGLHLAVRFRNGGTYLVYGYALVALITLLNFASHLFHHA